LPRRHQCQIGQAVNFVMSFAVLPGLLALNFFILEIAQVSVCFLYACPRFDGHTFPSASPQPTGV
jgi:hypothetical protein